MIDATVFSESKTDDDCENEFSQPDILEQNICLEKTIQTVGETDDDLMLNEIPSESLQLNNDDEHADEQEREQFGLKDHEVF